MFSIGQKVRIARLNPNDCADHKFANKTGVVIKREFGTGAWPVGESPTDPLYIVKTNIGQDGFWTEELVAEDK
jgi:hypothetical protein